MTRTSEIESIQLTEEEKQRIIWRRIALELIKNDSANIGKCSSPNVGFSEGKSVNYTMNEEWKDIDKWEGFYQVSNFGRVRSLDRIVWNPANQSNSVIKGRVKKLDYKGKKYYQIGLSKNGMFTKYLVHRLVATAFIPNPLNLPEVNHKDLNKFNNHISNLEWSTRLGNARHAKQNGSYNNFPNGEAKPNAKLTREAVSHIRQKVLRNIDYCRMYGVAPSTVTCIQKDNKRWSHASV